MFDIYAKYYDRLYKDKPYQKEIEFIYRWAKKPKVILDIGCGTASYWKYFPKRTEILGIEKSRKMIEQSLNKINIIHEDILDNPFKWMSKRFECVTALFDVINYIPYHHWWKDLPLIPGGFFIFDIWDKEKITKDGFAVTEKKVAGVKRIIRPYWYGNEVLLNITLKDKKKTIKEQHKIYLYSEKDIKEFCGKEFKIVDKKPTRTWQTWYKLERG